MNRASAGSPWENLRQWSFVFWKSCVASMRMIGWSWRRKRCWGCPARRSSLRGVRFDGKTLRASWWWPSVCTLI
jgi:hypothetical protein